MIYKAVDYIIIFLPLIASIMYGGFFYNIRSIQWNYLDYY